MNQSINVSVRTPAMVIFPWRPMQPTTWSPTSFQICDFHSAFTHLGRNTRKYQDRLGENDDDEIRKLLEETYERNRAYQQDKASVLKKAALNSTKSMVQNKLSMQTATTPSASTMHWKASVGFSPLEHHFYSVLMGPSCSLTRTQSWTDGQNISTTFLTDPSLTTLKPLHWGLKLRWTPSLLSL